MEKDASVTWQEGRLPSFQKVSDWMASAVAPTALPEGRWEGCLVRIVLMMSKRPARSAGPAVVLLPGPRLRALIRFYRAGYLSVRSPEPPA